jgi:hypothetical protein
MQIEQMGSIYAASQLTIVDAVGRDPDNGLPGVLSDRGARWIQLDSIYLTALPPVCGTEIIDESPWASRAWTFQEGVLSRRRLVFTKRQVVFICNTEILFEAKNTSSDDKFYTARWLPLRECDSGIRPMARALDYVSEYSKRKLSYDSDALKAIVGALNTLSDDSVYHLWGVPYQHTLTKTIASPVHLGATPTLSCELDNEDGFALLWCHGCPERRRLEFPSWSPLGWTGFPNFYQLPGHLTGWATVKTLGITLDIKGAKSALSSFVPSHAESATDISQLLEVHAETSDLRLQAPSDSSDNTCLQLEGTVIILPFNDEVNMFIYPSWSIDQSALRHAHALKCILIRASNDDHEEPQDWIIILKLCGSYYERIGIVQPPCFDPNSFAEDLEPWKCTVFRDQDMRPLSKNSLAYMRMEAEFLKDRRCLGRKWRELFAPETITLG